MSNLPSITILELEQHFEVLLPMVELIDRQSYRVRVCCQTGFYEEIEQNARDGIEWILLPSRDPTKWSEHIPSLQDQDLVIVLTLEAHPKYYDKLLQGTRYFVLVHNAVPVLHPFRLSFRGAEMRDYLTTVRHLYRQPRRAKILRAAYRIGFLNDQVLEYLGETVSTHIPFFMSPPIFYYREQKKVGRSRVHSEPLIVIVPGTIKKRGRNYDQILAALKLMAIEDLERMRLVLLGRPFGTYGKQILQQFRSLELPRECIYFEEVLSMHAYADWFYKADMVLCPFRKGYRLGLHKDKFGCTSISGVMNDLIRYGKPAICSQYHPFPPALERHAKRYETSHELAMLLRHAVHDMSEWIPDDQFCREYARKEKRAQLQKWLESLLVKRVAQ